MTAYKYTPTPEPSPELQKRIKAAKQRAANLAAQVEISRLEAVNAEAEATLHAAREHNQHLQAEIKRRRDESKKWPVHPDWMLHRKQLEHEVKMFQQGRTSRRLRGPEAAGSALQGLAGVVAPRTDSESSQARTTLRAVS